MRFLQLNKMETLLNIYRKNVGRRSLFEEVKDIDFYDGPTEALCKLVDAEQWFICSLVYVDFGKSERIYTMLEISHGSFSKLKSNLESQSTNQESDYEKLKVQVKAIYKDYTGKLFLFKSDWLNSVDYEVTKVSLRDLRYFSDIEHVLEQSEASKLKWIKLFSPR
jgi:hypothetical protein